ncbi:related to ketoreductases [Phialocephala subalpina]|uniref:Related to ketoreductases n=1 Tax=Phialocephala subalpina TaxID=576137 RepID=A0A1L7XEC4_9HELO|nr:related to ketoreductases [Phialocephala subalpina]
MTPLTWLITGCSSGIGEAFVHEILSRGDRVIATARNASARLKSLETAGAKILDLDVTASEDELKEKIEEAKSESTVDGFRSHEQWLKMLNTNLLDTINLTRAILPHFRKKKSGKLVFIGSENGWRAGAGNAAYSVTTFALEGFVEVLQKETSHLGIQSIIFQPGEFRTTVLSSSSKSSKLSEDPDYGELAKRVQAGLKASDGKQKGDLKKGVRVMVDVVKGEGVAEGRGMPRRLMLGKECLETVRGKCRETLEICDKWEGVIGSVDFDDGE